MSAKDSEKESRLTKHKENEEFAHNVRKVHNSRKHDAFDYDKKMKEIRTKRYRRANKPKSDSDVKFKNTRADEKPDAGINRSSNNIQFESNDILDDYKK